MPPKHRAGSTPTYLTFRHSYTSTLLIATLITPFLELITELLSALSSRYPNGLPTGELPSDSPSTSFIPIPTNPHCVRIALLADPDDASKGYREIPWIRYSDNILKNNPLAWGVEEGGTLAFTFSDEAIGKEDQDEDLAEHEAEGFSIEWPAAHLVKNEDMENGYADGEDEAMVDGSGEDSEMEREVLKATLNVGNRVR